jgi:DNA-directed RNA polymerase subunit RPC12/RpoP
LKFVHFRNHFSIVGECMAADNFFLCPNGHRINWSENLAGRDAKCPRCGVLLRIPNTSGATAQVLAGGTAGAGVTEPNIVSSAPAEQNSIAFLCPNGHRLVGPARLQGQAGQCPHCGARFLVPMLNEMEQVEEVDLTDLPAEDDRPLQTVEDVPPPLGGVHPLCKLLRKLWEERQRGAVIELHLEGGMILVPDWFDDKLSRHSHGLFAAQAADGTLTMTIVGWNTISRVVVRNVEGLPDGMFE